LKIWRLLDRIKPLLKNTLYGSASLPVLKKYLRYWQGPCAIFCFHRVLPDAQAVLDKSPTSNLIISESHFREIIEYLNNQYQIITLDELIQHLKRGLKKKVVCLTFDDGYKDNLYHALPILEQFNCPATLYITTCFAEGNTSMWWYELWDYVRSKEGLIKVDFEGRYKIWECSDLSQKYKCYSELSSWMMVLPLDRQQSLLKVLTNTEERKYYHKICLDWDEITKLDRHPLMTIGAHTHSHPILSLEDEETTRNEILFSKVLLEKRLGHSVDHLAYPFGSYKEVGLREYQLAEACGYLSAATTRCFPANYSHRFQLPRYGITERTTPSIIEKRIGGLSNLLRLQLG